MSLAVKEAHPATTASQRSSARQLADVEHNNGLQLYLLEMGACCTAWLHLPDCLSSLTRPQTVDEHNYRQDNRWNYLVTQIDEEKRRLINVEPGSAIDKRVGHEYPYAQKWTIGDKQQQENECY